MFEFARERAIQHGASRRLLAGEGAPPSAPRTRAESAAWIMGFDSGAFVFTSRGREGLCGLASARAPVYAPDSSREFVGKRYPTLLRLRFPTNVPEIFGALVGKW